MFGIKTGEKKSSAVNIVKIFVVIVVIFATLVPFSVNVLAETPVNDFPYPPSGPPSSGGSGGSGGYSPASFEKYTEYLKSSDGSVIGHFDGEDFNSVFVWAERNGTVGNATYSLTVEGELYSKPDNCWLDISFLGPGASKVPPGMEDGLVLGVINVTKNPNDWSYKSGSPKFTLKVSGLAQNINPDDTYYLVRCDGINYQVQKISIDVSGSQASIKLNPQGDTGVFTLIKAQVSTQTPTPTPTSVPTPTPTPVPSNDSGMWGFPIFIAVFAVGAIAGAVVLFLVMRNR